MLALFKIKMNGTMNYRHSAVFIWIIVLHLFSCETKIQDNYGVPSREVNFPHYVDVFYDPGLQQEIAYYFDEENYLIYFYDLYGHAIDTIDISIIKQEFAKGLVTVKSMDTIIVNSIGTTYSNKIYILNGKGEIIKAHDLDLLMTDSLGNYYSILSYPIFFDNNINRLIFQVDWRMNSIDQKKGIIPQMAAENKYTEYWHQSSNKAAVFVELDDLLSENPKINFKLMGFTSRMDDRPVWYVPLLFIRNMTWHNKIVLCYRNTDKLYLINNKSFAIDTIVKVQSKYSTLTNKPFDKNEEKDLNNYLLKNNSIMDFGQNKHNGKLHISINHYNENKSRRTIIQLDKNLKTQKEFVKDSNYYSTFLNTNEGLFLAKKPDKNQLRNEKKVTYTLFNFD